MTAFDEWWAKAFGDLPNYADNPVVKEPARAAWHTAVAAERERCANVLLARAAELRAANADADGQIYENAARKIREGRTP